MARCAYCEAETEHYDGSTPICVQCVETSLEKRVARAKLFQDLHEATKRTDAATEAFAQVTGNIPGGTPHPDGVQRIHNASREMTAARMDMLKAHHRLNDFLNTGIVPEDLKRTG